MSAEPLPIRQPLTDRERMLLNALCVVYNFWYGDIPKLRGDAFKLHARAVRAVVEEAMKEGEGLA